jgi:hypothetical protein
MREGLKIYRVLLMVNKDKTIVRDMYFNVKSELFGLANYMRKHPTEAERILWERGIRGGEVNSALQYRKPRACQVPSST